MKKTLTFRAPVPGATWAEISHYYGLTTWQSVANPNLVKDDDGFIHDLATLTGPAVRKAET